MLLHRFTCHQYTESIPIQRASPQSSSTHPRQKLTLYKLFIFFLNNYAPDAHSIQRHDTVFQTSPSCSLPLVYFIFQSTESISFVCMNPFKDIMALACQSTRNLFTNKTYPKSISKQLTHHFISS